MKTPPPPKTGVFERYVRLGAGFWVCAFLLLSAGLGSPVPAQSLAELNAGMAIQADLNAAPPAESNVAAPVVNPTPAPEKPPLVTENERHAEQMRILNDLVRQKREESAKMTPEERKKRLEEDRKGALDKRLRERQEREQLSRMREAEKAQEAAALALEKARMEKERGSIPVFTGISCVLQVRPFRQTVRPGQRFVTEVALYSESAFEFDKLDIRLAYSPTDVKPLQVFDYPLAEALDAANPPTHSLGQGLLSYSASLKGPVKALESASLLYVLWEVVGENRDTELSLGRYGQSKTMNSAVYFEGKNLLEPKTLVGASCVSANVTIASGEKNEGPGLRLVRDPVGQDASGSGTGETVRLVLEAPQPPPAAGDEFILHVRLENPNYVAFDQVRLAVRFDPRRVEVLDWDTGGWIRRGVNVYDAHAHAYFPFNVHTANTVSNSLGRISYEMGSSVLRPMPSGSLVQIRCRARTAQAAESFQLFLGRESRDWFTDVRAAGASVLARVESSPVPSTALSQAQ